MAKKKKKTVVDKHFELTRVPSYGKYRMESTPKVNRHLRRVAFK